MIRRDSVDMALTSVDYKLPVNRKLGGVHFVEAAEFGHLWRISAFQAGMAIGGLASGIIWPILLLGSTWVGASGGPKCF